MGKKKKKCLWEVMWYCFPKGPLVLKDPFTTQLRIYVFFLRWSHRMFFKESGLTGIHAFKLTLLPGVRNVACVYPAQLLQEERDHLQRRRRKESKSVRERERSTVEQEGRTDLYKDKEQKGALRNTGRRWVVSMRVTTVVMMETLYSDICRSLAVSQFHQACVQTCHL